MLNHAVLCDADEQLSHSYANGIYNQAWTGGFCSQMKSWTSSWHPSYEQQQMWSQTMIFGNSALPNTGLMSTQLFFSYRDLINTESSQADFFFQFSAKTHCVMSI